jgi:hypothetical protein
MDRQVKVVSNITLDREDLLLIMKSLDVYAYSLFACGALDELEDIHDLAKRVIKVIPPAELDS